MTLRTEAHPMPNSIVELSVLKNTINGKASVPFVELENALGNNKDSVANISFLKAYFYKHITVKTQNTNWTVAIDSVYFETNLDMIIGKYQEVKVSFVLYPPREELLRNFTFDYDAVIHQVITHSILVILSDDWQNGIHQELEKKNLV